jgi:hypothetical protein
MNAKSRKNLPLGVLLAIAIAMSLTGCDDELVQDPTFRQWCGDTLCAWTLETGAIQRAPTWHHADYGVEFTGTPTRISQYSDKNPSCLLFTAIADVDPRAQMTVELDFNSDGRVDYTWPIPSSKWHQVQTLVTAPRVQRNALFGAWDGFTIAIHKTGPGRAVLAQMRVQSAKECDATVAAKVDGIPLGKGCGPDAECAAGICCMPWDGKLTSTKIENLGYCAECCPAGAPCLGDDCNRACGAGTVCRSQKPADFFFGLACRPPLLKPGDPCDRSEECESQSCGPNYVVPDGGYNPEYRGPFEPSGVDCRGDGGSVAQGCVPEMRPKTYCR